MLGFDLRERALDRRDLLAQRAPARGRVVGGPGGSAGDTYSAAAISRGSTPVSRASRAASAAMLATVDGRCGVEATNVPLPCWLSIRPSCSRRW